MGIRITFFGYGWRFANRVGLGKRLNKNRSSRNGSHSASSFSKGDVGNASTGIGQSAKGIFSNPVLKAGIISGSLSLAGDLIAQFLTINNGNSTYDASRALRMGSFGLVCYGPYQHYWYGALDKLFPARTISNFVAKVTLNQVCLAPIVITGVFAWNLGLQQKLEEFPAKLKKDFGSTLITGWKFWVPAATINFAFIPLQHQVLYMSLCGVIWTAFLSYSSTSDRILEHKT